MTVEVTYNPPANGLGTDFSNYDRPISFAQVYTNRFRNVTGGAERRPGIEAFSSASVPTFPNLTRLHEYVSNTGVETLLTSDDFGNIYVYGASAWSLARSGGSQARYISAMSDGKLIFVNGIDRNLYTDDGGATFKELVALITRGTMAGGSGPTTLIDGDISNWVGATLVANNDIVYNVTRGGYGIVTTVASAALTHTTIGTGGTGAGLTGANQAPGDVYQLIDYVDMNIIPDGAGGFDNVATATGTTSSTVVSVSGVDFSGTEIRRGDFIYNTTRGAVSMVAAISADVNLQQAITAQTAGDALVFFKSAMPISSWVHVHYGRTAFLDARNNNRVVFSAPDDPEDVTTYQKTLESTSFSFASDQPAGDALLSLSSFLSYFAASGKRNLYIYKGQTPIADNSGTDINFEPIATYPNGIASRFGMATNGGDLLHITIDGLQAINIGYNTSNTVQNNASVPIRNTLRNLIAATGNRDDIQVAFYPRRSWVINKIGDQCYILNTSPSYAQDGSLKQLASWHLFNGPWAGMNHYFVRRNGDLLGCGANGMVYNLDNGAATDNGIPIATDLVMPWLRLEEPQSTPRIKELKYIKPIFESSSQIDYTINAVAGLDNYSSDSITVSAGGTGAIGTFVIGTTPIGGGSFAQNNKYPLRVRGEQMQIEITTASSAMPDVITAFTLYGNILGRR